ncbi:MAG: chemotaxis protein MotB [Myxococcota bacterium]|jgi:chemotaxis protein MotB
MLCLWMFSACVVPRARYQLLSEAEQRDSAAAAIDLAAVRYRADRLTVDLAAEASRAGDLAATVQAERAALLAAQEAFAADKAAMLNDRSRLTASMAELQLALRDLERRRAAAEARVAEFKDLLARFRDLIDAGTLQVKIVNGRMVVQLATDVLFASGRADLSDEGGAALDSVAAILASIPLRAFQVEGHTDDVPIRTTRFPSNWELAAARSIGVARRLVEGGLAADRVSAASFGEHRPTAANGTAEGRRANRRIEIVVVPDLSELPGAEALEAL